MKTKKHTYFRECPECGACLDPDEICDCQEKRSSETDMKTPEKKEQEGRKTA